MKGATTKSNPKANRKRKIER